MIIKVWDNFEKRQNSTKVPGEPDREITVRLKDNTSKLRPVFYLQSDITPNVRYVQWDDWYYFVNDIVFVTANTWELHCKNDALATNRGKILASSQYVERSAVEYRIDIPDAENARTVVVSETTATATTTNPFDSGRNGCIILGCIGGTPRTVKDGVITYYALTLDMLRQLAAVLSGEDFIDGLRNQFTNPMDAITSCKWVNFDYSYLSVTATMQQIKLGASDTFVTAAALNTRVYQSQVLLTWEPYDAEYYSYINFAPYTQGRLFLPYVGTVPLDIDINNTNTARITQIVDIYTGMVTYKVTGNSAANIDMPISIYQGECGVDVPISNISRNYMAMLTGTMSAIGSAALGNPMGVVGGVVDTLSSLVSHTQNFNGNGTVNQTYIADDKVIRALISTQIPIHAVRDVLARVGLPLMQYRQLSSLVGGYCQCRKASINIRALDSERTEIEGALENGVYLE